MGKRIFLWAAAAVALICAVAISAVFFLTVWDSRTAPPQIVVPETEPPPPAPAETEPEPEEDWP